MRKEQMHKVTILSDLVFFQRGFDITKAQQRAGDIPVVSSSGIKSYHSIAKVKGPGVVIGRKGTLGSIHFIKEDYWPHDTTLWSKNFKGNNPRFVYYFLKVLRLAHYNVGNANPTLNRNHIHGLKINIPPLNTQLKIASILSAYDDLIENNRRRIQLLEESARLLYMEWFVNFRFPGHEKIKIVDGVPEGWETGCASDILDVMSGGTPKTKVPDYWDGDIPFFTPKDATDTPYVLSTEKTLSEEGLKKCNSKFYPKNTIFITARGTVGKLNLAQKSMAMNQSCYALKAKAPLNQLFLYSALEASIAQFKSRASGAVFDAIVVDTFKFIPFITPPKILISEFTKIAEPIFTQIEILLIQNQKLAEARDLLLPRLMNGEIEV